MASKTLCFVSEATLSTPLITLLAVANETHASFATSYIVAFFYAIYFPPNNTLLYNLFFLSSIKNNLNIKDDIKVLKNKMYSNTLEKDIRIIFWDNVYILDNKLYMFGKLDFTNKDVIDYYKNLYNKNNLILKSIPKRYIFKRIKILYCNYLISKKIG